MLKPKARATKAVAKVKLKPDAKPARKKLRPGEGCLYSEAELHEMFGRFQLQRPNPRSDLTYINPFTLLVAVVLSAQATDASVNIATTPLFEVADTPEKMAALGEEEIGRYVRTIGLWRAKAKNVQLLSEALIRDHAGQVPRTEEELIRLPGVGRKTANVVRNNAFGHPTMGVDTHIFRLGNRIHLAPGATPDEVERGLLAVIPPEFLLHAHHWLILHGRYVCKARRPECERCIIADLCKAEVKTNSVPAPIVQLD
ncbi:MAG: endonuclease III [Methylobacterium mesophilicum]|nr:endonuclease III [Methylobacterium mesophilicum]